MIELKRIIYRAEQIQQVIDREKYGLDSSPSRFGRMLSLEELEREEEMRAVRMILTVGYQDVL